MQQSSGRSILKFTCFLLALIICGRTALAGTNTAAPKQDVLLILGDSVMKSVGVSLERQLAQGAQYQTVSFISIGSGLCRLDLLDWHDKIATLAKEHKPAAVVMMIGANDNQPMQTDRGFLSEGSKEWRSEYARRVSECMDVMITSGIKKIVWISLPDVREPDRQRHIENVNRIFEEAAAARPAVVILSTQKIFSRTPGKFTVYMLGPDGRPVNVRSPDGVHFNREGANRLAQAIIERLDELRAE